MSTETQTEVVMPQMGVSVSEGTITKWLKQVGETVVLDEPLLEISTDKVDTEVPSPGEGVVTEIRHQEGETVDVGTVLAVIAAAPPAAAEPEPEAEAVSEPAPGEPAETFPRAAEPAAPAPAGAPILAQSIPEAPTGNGKTFVSPVVARIASEHGVDPGAVPGTGQGGRVTKKDILTYIESVATAAVPQEPVQPVAPPPPQPAAPPPPALAAWATPPPPTPAEPPPSLAPAAAAPLRPAPPAPPTSGDGLLPGETMEPITAMRRGIAEHMRRSLDTSAHVTTVFEVDMARVVALRQALKPDFQQQGVNLTYLAFIAQATVAALKDWPWLNAELRGESIVTKSFVNLGIAVALEGGKGLIVPVIHGAQDLNLLGLARAIADVAERARSKRLLPDDVQGGSFTITNPGGWGAVMGTPVISQPQVGILDVEALVKRPVVVTDEMGNDVIAIRPMMNLCLSYDHRLVDGAYAAQFMKQLREALESTG